MRHDGKKAIVTGAADGIGRATAIQLVNEGANVLAVDRNQAGLDSLKAEYGEIHLLKQDVAAPDAPKNICNKALNLLAGIDYLINVAGVVSAPNSLIESQAFTDWKQVIDVNLHAVFAITQAAIPALKESQGGRLVNIGSIMSELASRGMGAYAASKHAIAGLTKTLALELGPYGITANYILPGAIVTGITRPALAAGPGFEDFWSNKSPLGRLGQPEDIAMGICFLLSKDASFITGHGLTIDGGVMQSS
jgi:NAD(P)-dependent dehydrogenase (short-subunit alcohol dehydrogenase family)